MVIRIITRTEWGARPPRGGPFPTTSWSLRNNFVVHYSGANKLQTVRQIQNYQMDNRGWRDIGYNFLVDYKGNAFEGCQGTWLAVGAHVAGSNTSSIGVCAIGTNADITDAQMRTIRALYDEANRRAGKTLNKRYHSGMPNANTACPGDRLRNWVTNGMKISSGEENKVANFWDEGQHAEAIVYRHEGLIAGRTNVAAGPTAGEVIWPNVTLRQILANLNTLVGKDFVDEAAIVTGVLNGLGTKEVEEIADALRAVMTEEKLAALKAIL